MGMNTEELVALCPLFRGILPEELHALLHCLSAQELSPPKGGFILASPGTQPLIGVVLEGSVQMISEDSFGKRSLIMVLSKGSIFGESYSCMKARNRSIAYQANEASRILILDYGRILHACKLPHHIAVNSPINGSHHIANDIWFVHQNHPFSFIIFFASFLPESTNIFPPPTAIILPLYPIPAH